VSGDRLAPTPGRAGGGWRRADGAVSASLRLAPTPARPARRSAPGVRKGCTAVPCKQPCLTPRERGRGQRHSRVASWWSAIGASWLLATVLLSPAVAADAASDDVASVRAHDNAALVRAAFDDWRAGTGSVFDLLADGAQWTVAGDSPVSGVYTSKQDFLDRAVAPIVAKLATPIVPEVQHVVAQDDAVVVVWRGVARAHDGSAYANHYAWHMVFDDDGRIVRVVAFLDTWALDALMR
jgi:uncharacterized protein